MVETETSILDAKNPPEYEPLVESVQVDENIGAQPSSMTHHHNTNDPSTTPASNANNDVIPTLDETDQLQQQHLVASGVGAGAVGLLLGGPLLAAVLGLGSVYAYDKEGALGDAARATGTLALSVRDRAREIDEKHHVVEQSRAAATEAWEKAKEMDRRHNVLEKVKVATVRGFQVTVDFVKRHNLIERGVESIGKAVYWAADKLASAISKPSNDERQSTSE